MHKFFTASAIAIALASASNTSNAALVFIEHATFDLTGGTILKADLYTNGPATISSGSNYTIDAIGGEFIEAAISKGQPSLWATGVQFGSAGNTPTDNNWLSALNGGTHLSTGGFAFTYGSDPADRYQVFYAAGSYQGCWAVGTDCKVLATPLFSSTRQFDVPTNPQPIPEPGEWAMILFGFGIVGWQVKRKQSKAELSVR